jgi:hypothetical protein
MGTNNFVAMPAISPGAAGGQPAVDLLVAVPTSGLDDDLTFLCSGQFSGSISVQGSTDGSDWSTLCQFDSTNLVGGLMSPVLVPSTAVRYLRAFINGAVITTVSLSVGAEINCYSVPSSATWTLGVTRIYAVDGVNGNDLNKGYADPTTTGNAAYQVACAAAGLVAKKTLAGLAQIFPIDGAGRRVEIVVANGGVNTVGTYTDSLSVVLAGVTGYLGPCVRTTGTNPTAGVVAFDGSATDVAYLGAITATGMNVAGYNPTGAPTTTVVQCLQVGGAAPGFGTEPLIPFGARIRFDVNTTTAALRNVIREVVKVDTANTLTFPDVLPAVPVASDVFYIELPGVSLPGMTIFGNWTVSATMNQIVGFSFSTLASVGDGRYQVGFCQVATTQSLNFTGCPAAIVNRAYTHPVRGNITVGPTRVGSTAGSASASFTNSGVSSNGLCVAGVNSGSNITITNPTSLVLTAGVATNGPINFTQLNQLPCGNTINVFTNATPNVGGTGAVVSVPVRTMDGLFSFAQGGNISISQCSVVAIVNAQGCLIFDEAFTQFVSASYRINLAEARANTFVTGSSPAGGLGISLTNNSLVILDPSNLPTIAGSFGQVGTGQTQMTWSQASNGGNGFSDRSGSRFQGLWTGNSNFPLKFSGTLFGGAAATLTYLSDAGDALAVNNTTPMAYPGTGLTFGSLVVKPRVNTMANSCTVKLYINGAPSTGILVTIPAGSTALQTFVIPAPNNFAGVVLNGDTYDLRIDDAAADAGHTLAVSAILTFS